MKTSDSTGKINGAIAKTQAKLHNVPMDATNPAFKSPYAKLPGFLEAARELAQNETAFLQSPSADGNLVRMVTTLRHSSGEWIESDVLQVQARDAGPQAVGSCITYLRRYQLASMLGLAPDEDDNGEAAEGRGLASAPMPHKKVADTAPPINLEEIAKLKIQMPEPSGVVTIRSVTSAPTKREGVTQYKILFSDGVTLTTIKDKLAQACMEFKDDGVPLVYDMETKGTFKNLVSITRADTGEIPNEYNSDIPF